MLNLTAATLLVISQTSLGAPPPEDARPPAQAVSAPASPDAAQGAQRAPQTATGSAPGDILVTGRRLAGDPLRSVNAKAFAATEAADRALVRPLSMAYKHAIPRPARQGIHNFLYNLREPLVFVNFMLQLKPGKAAETAGRFAVNSTIGVAGLVDVARRRPFHLPRRANGFADTLGYYGVKNGPFLFLPITGPTTVRDLIGGTLDRLLLPLAVGTPFNKTAFTAPVGILGALDHRADFDPTLKRLHDGVADPYAESRDFYLARRQAEIDQLHGRGVGTTSPVGEAPVDAVNSIPFPGTTATPPPSNEQGSPSK